MSKIVKMFVIMMAVMIQIVVSILYGFSNIQISSVGCFVVWCVCAVLINRVAVISETI